MMRILIINPEYPPVGGGASNASAHIARTLVDLGQQVAVLTSRYADLPKDETLSGVRVFRGPARRRHLDRSGAFEQAMFMLSGSLGAIRLLRSWRPQVVLAFFGAPSGVIALLMRLFFGTPYIVSLRGGDVPGFRPYDFALYHRLIGPLLHIVWRQAAAVVANSQGLRALGQTFDQRVPIRVIPNGVDVPRESLTHRQWHPPKLLIVGRLRYQKGIDILLRALCDVLDLPWELTIAGDGPQRAALEAMAAELKLSSRLGFTRWLDKETLSEEYQSANLFVYPSRHEGMPNVILEAMASGLPVVASRIAGSEELVIPEETGLLVPPEDPVALSKALRRLLGDTALRQQMGQAAQQRVREHYTWSSVAQQYLDLMQATGGKH